MHQNYEVPVTNLISFSSEQTPKFVPWSTMVRRTTSSSLERDTEQPVFSRLGQSRRRSFWEHLEPACAAAFPGGHIPLGSKEFMSVGVFAVSSRDKPVRCRIWPKHEPSDGSRIWGLQEPSNLRWRVERLSELGWLPDGSAKCTSSSVCASSG